MSDQDEINGIQCINGFIGDLMHRDAYEALWTGVQLLEKSLTVTPDVIQGEITKLSQARNTLTAENVYAVVDQNQEQQRKDRQKPVAIDLIDDAVARLEALVSVNVLVNNWRAGGKWDPGGAGSVKVKALMDSVKEGRAGYITLSDASYTRPKLTYKSRSEALCLEVLRNDPDVRKVLSLGFRREAKSDTIWKDNSPIGKEMAREIKILFLSDRSSTEEERMGYMNTILALAEQVKKLPNIDIDLTSQGVPLKPANLQEFVSKLKVDIDNLANPSAIINKKEAVSGRRGWSDTEKLAMNQKMTQLERDPRLSKLGLEQPEKRIMHIIHGHSHEDPYTQEIFRRLSTLRKTLPDTSPVTQVAQKTSIRETVLKGLKTAWKAIKGLGKLRKRGESEISAAGPKAKVERAPKQQALFDILSVAQESNKSKSNDSDGSLDVDQKNKVAAAIRKLAGLKRGDARALNVEQFKKDLIGVTHKSEEIVTAINVVDKLAPRINNFQERHIVVDDAIAKADLIDKSPTRSHVHQGDSAPSMGVNRESRESAVVFNTDYGEVVDAEAAVRQRVDTAREEGGSNNGNDAPPPLPPKAGSGRP